MQCPTVFVCVRLCLKCDKESKLCRFEPMSQWSEYEWKRMNLCKKNQAGTLTHIYVCTSSVYLPIASNECVHVCVCVYDSGSGNMYIAIVCEHIASPVVHVCVPVCMYLCLSVPLGVYMSACVCAHDLYLNIVFVLFFTASAAAVAAAAISTLSCDFVCAPILGRSFGFVI